MHLEPSAVFHRVLGGTLPRALRARGVWIEDSEGKRYLDASGGALVANVGHGREEIARAVKEAILSLSYVHGTMFTNDPVEKLAASLSRHAPAGIECFYFLTSGSEAVEAAIKMARQIHLEEGRPGREVLISRWNSYHGLSLGALAATGRSFFRTPFGPLMKDAVHIPPPYCLRCSFGLVHPECGLRCARFLEETIQRVGPSVVSAFVAETVSGASLACCPPPPGYWKCIREICDRYEVLLIMDEVMCGMGRTGKWFASEHYGVSPDLVTLGKGIAGGVQPLSAVGLRAEFRDLMARGSGSFVHGGTYTHHPVACSAGLAVVRIIEEEGLVERCAEMGKVLEGMLREALEGSAHVGDIRGIGLMWGVELVAEKESMRPYPRKEKVAEKIWQYLFAKGIITYRSVGFAGLDGDAIILGPPFIIQEDELQLAVEAIGEAIEKILG
ncbi:MAG: aminotransferase class III-fold pyridoxal phosphate-dependent enzyme [bacterium]